MLMAFDDFFDLWAQCGNYVTSKLDLILKKLTSHSKMTHVTKASGYLCA